ncbi:MULTISPECIES: acyltransferase family protein [unclassified Saccharothrix]|uniref:acyltransferase family protein n=1 Tax=unclassified Saccharothrix TaxID=2593673 RepID=UPI00307D77F8
MTATAERPATATRKDNYMHGLDLLRVVGSCLVVLTHLVAWFRVYDRDMWLVDAVEAGVVGPLHINEDMHFLGVAIFLVVSGVVVTHVADRESPGQFLRRRIVRLMPLLWAVTLVAWLALQAGVHYSEVKPENAGMGALLSNMVLAGFFTKPAVVLIGVTWTLLVQIGFYAYVAATIPVLRRQPWIAPLAAAVLCFVVILSTFDTKVRAFGQIGGLIGYLPLLCIGQLVSLVHSRKISPLVGTAIGAAHFAVVVWVDKLYRYAGMGEAVPRTLLIAVLVTVLLVRMDGPVCRSAFVKAWAKRTYAVYLVHMLAMYPLFELLVPHVDGTLLVVLGLVSVALLTEVAHRFVEAPADRAIRKWERRHRERRAPDPAA